MAMAPAAALAFVVLAGSSAPCSARGPRMRSRSGRLAGWMVAGLVVAAGVATMLMIPHPGWMWAAGIAAAAGRRHGWRSD